MKIKSILPYFGCKRMQTANIIKHLGEHHAFWDIFCGSLAVIFSKSKCRTEAVNDLNGRLVALARVIQDDRLCEMLMSRLERTLFCETLFEESVQWFAKYPACTNLVDIAYHYFVVSWMGRSGLTGTTKELDVGFSKRYTTNGGDSATRFRNAVRALPEWWERLQGVTILSQDGISLLDKIEDNSGVAIYCDPPYLKKGSQYQYDFKPEQHALMAEKLLRFRKTRCVVSYYLEPEIESLYPASHWDRIDCTTVKQMGNGKTEAPEVLFVNRPEK